MNTILFAPSKRMQYHTDLRPIFEAFQGRQKEFNWLITDFECNHAPGKAITWMYENDNGYGHWKDKVWIPGEELTEIVYDNYIQFWMGVISGFKKEVKIELDNLTHYPYAEENPHFESDKPKIQHPLATVEILCFDSSFTLLLSKDNNLSERFRDYFIDAQDLNEYMDKKWKTRIPSR